MAADQGGPRETEGLEPDYAYGPSPRQLPTRPSSGAGPQYVSGTVLALRGSIRYATTGKTVVPTAVVARQQVPTGGEYDFHLPPGHYVIEHHYLGGNVTTWVSVVLRSGITVHANLPNICK